MTQIKKRNIQIFILFLMILIGTLTGSILYIQHPDWHIWNNMTFRQGMGILTEHRAYCIAAPIFWLAVTAILGLSATGLPLIPCILFLRGAALGAVLEMLYLDETAFHAGLRLLLIMPYAYATSFVMLFGAREALRFSLEITGLLCEKVHDDEDVSVKLYIIRFLILFAFMLILGMIQNFLLLKFS